MLTDYLHALLASYSHACVCMAADVDMRIMYTFCVVLHMQINHAYLYDVALSFVGRTCAQGSPPTRIATRAPRTNIADLGHNVQ